MNLTVCQWDALDFLRRGVVYNGHGIRLNTIDSLKRLALCTTQKGRDGSWRAEITPAGRGYEDKKVKKRGKKKAMAEEELPEGLTDEECAILYQMGTRRHGRLNSGEGVAKTIVSSLAKRGLVSVNNGDSYYSSSRSWVATLTPLGFASDEASL